MSIAMSRLFSAASATLRAISPVVAVCSPTAAAIPISAIALPASPSVGLDGLHEPGEVVRRLGH